MLEQLKAALILVVEDVHEISDGIEKLLKTDGYVYLTRPDRFNQLRGLLARLLDQEIPRVHGTNEFAGK